jgi:hypothetical protein
MPKIRSIGACQTREASGRIREQKHEEVRNTRSIGTCQKDQKRKGVSNTRSIRAF